MKERRGEPYTEAEGVDVHDGGCRGSARCVPVRRAPLAGVENFLLLQYPAALGTAVHATPLIPALKAAQPDCRIVVAASGLATPLFAFHPDVERLVMTRNPLTDLRGAVRDLRTARLFAGERFVAVTTMGNERTRVGWQR